jgi:predicted Zn-dependent peptidase
LREIRTELKEEIRTEKEKLRKEKEEFRKEKEELQRQMEEMRGLTSQARLCQQSYTGSLGYGVPEPIPQAVQAVPVNDINNRSQDFTDNSQNIVCYNCESPGQHESPLLETRESPES